MSEKSARLDLPFLIPGQAQKEFFHNEALARIDMILCAAVEGAPSSSPPPSPEAGQCWIVGQDATEAWAGQADALACWTTGGWRFVAPLAGMTAWDKSAGLFRHWNGSAWSDGEIHVSKIIVEGNQVVGPRQPAIPSPAGGAVIDLEARQAIASICAALMSHGLIS